MDAFLYWFTPRRFDRRLHRVAAKRFRIHGDIARQPACFDRANGFACCVDSHHRDLALQRMFTSGLMR